MKSSLNESKINSGESMYKPFGFISTVRDIKPIPSNNNLSTFATNTALHTPDTFNSSFMRASLHNPNNINSASSMMNFGKNLQEIKSKANSIDGANGADGANGIIIEGLEKREIRKLSLRDNVQTKVNRHLSNTPGDKNAFWNHLTWAKYCKRSKSRRHSLRFIKIAPGWTGSVYNTTNSNVDTHNQNQAKQAENKGINGSGQKNHEDTRDPQSENDKENMRLALIAKAAYTGSAIEATFDNNFTHIVPGERLGDGRYVFTFGENFDTATFDEKTGNLHFASGITWFPLFFATDHDSNELSTLDNAYDLQPNQTMHQSSLYPPMYHQAMHHKPMYSEPIYRPPTYFSPSQSTLSNTIDLDLKPPPNKIAKKNEIYRPGLFDDIDNKSNKSFFNQIEYYNRRSDNGNTIKRHYNPGTRSIPTQSQNPNPNPNSKPKLKLEPTPESNSQGKSIQANSQRSNRIDKKLFMGEFIGYLATNVLAIYLTVFLWFM